MPHNYEAKILDVDLIQISIRIACIGGKVDPGMWWRRHIYDIADGGAPKQIWLDDNGSRTTLTLKEIAQDGTDKADKTEVTVDNFVTTNELLGKLGHTSKSYEEIRCLGFTLYTARLEVTSCLPVPPYLEIKTDTQEQLLAVATKLGFAEDRLTDESTESIFARHGIDLASMPDFRFADLSAPPTLMG